MKIATWNVNSLKVRLPQVLAWLAAQQPDILALQETKLTDDCFPAEAIRAAGYQVVYAGQKTYNGVALLSKQAAHDIVTALPGLDDPQRRVLGATFGDLRVLNVYVPNGQAVGSDKFAYKLDWLDKLHDYVAEQLRQHPRFVLLGDFNIAPDERDVHDPALWQGQVLVSAPERAALQRLLKVGLHDSFRLFDQPDAIYSWWDYRMGAFRRNMGLRIDLVLVSEALKTHCAGAYIDKEPRRNQQPSDHAPAVAQLDI